MKKHKLRLAALTLPILMTSGISFAATPNTCPTPAEFSHSEVKYIGVVDGEHLFLNADGNRVAPCTQNKQTKFYLLSGYKDGDLIYNYVQSREYVTDSGLTGRNGGFSYGEKVPGITDTFDFRTSYLTNEFTEGSMPATAKVNIVFKKEWLDNVPQAYAKLPAEKKQALIKYHYQQIFQRYGSIDIDTNNFVKDSVIHNREIKPVSETINQFTLDKAFTPVEVTEEDTEENSKERPKQLQTSQMKADYGEIDGVLFLRYKAATAEQEYLRAIPENILAVLTNEKNYTLDQRLSLAHKFADAHFANEQAKQYSLSWQPLLADRTDELNTIGLQEYNSMSKEDKFAYNQILVSINNAIFDKEYNQLKDELTPEEFSQLGDIDKTKYEKEKLGHKKFTYKKVRNFDATEEE